MLRQRLHLLYHRLRNLLSYKGLRHRTKWLFHRLGWLNTYWRTREALRRWRSALGPRRLRLSARWLRNFYAAGRRRRRETRLTVAVDVTPLWEPLTGIGWYLYRLLEHLAAREDLRLRLYGPSLVDTPDLPAPVVALPTGPALELVTYQVPEDLSFSYVKVVERLRARQDRLIAKDGNDLLFAPNYFLPPAFGRARGRLVATVHDLSVRKVPHTMRESTRQQLEQELERTLERATAILTDTEAVRAELLATGLVEAERVQAVHLGPGPVVGVDEGAPPENTPQRYVLFVGTLEPRKGVSTLLDAWEILRKGGQQLPVLVLCGRYGWKSEDLKRRIDSPGNEAWVRHFGYLEDAQVAALYRGAELVVLPSLYEGFGLPAVEAMWTGRPMLLSDIPVLREVGGEAAEYAPPEEPQAWADALLDLLSDPGRLEALAQHGRERAQLFTWQRTAEATVEAWRQAAGR